MAKAGDTFESRGVKARAMKAGALALLVSGVIVAPAWGGDFADRLHRAEFNSCLSTGSFGGLECTAGWEDRWAACNVATDEAAQHQARSERMEDI